jgi:hypothetical protein
MRANRFVMMMMIMVMAYVKNLRYGCKVEHYYDVIGLIGLIIAEYEGFWWNPEQRK